MSIIPDILKYYYKMTESEVPVTVSLTLWEGLNKNNLIQTVVAPEQFKPVENVKLWYPRGLGNQSLYTLTVSGCSCPSSWSRSDRSFLQTRNGGHVRGDVRLPLD